MGFNLGFSGISGRRIRCRFCSIPFKYESVIINHETRLHKAEIKKAEEMEKIHQIINFLKSEETNFDKVRKKRQF